MNIIKQFIPVIPSQDTNRDCEWYKNKLGFQVYYVDNMYAILYRETFVFHLQWHADTPEDPLLGGSVIRVWCNSLKEIFEEFVEKGTIEPSALIKNTGWGTSEFGVKDLNGNLWFFQEEI